MTENKTTLIVSTAALLGLGLAVSFSTAAPTPTAGSTRQAAVAAATPSRADGEHPDRRDATTTSAPAGLYGAVPGSRFRYAFTTDRRFTMTAKGRTGSEVRFAGEGELAMVVAARRDAEILVEMRCTDLRLEGVAAEGNGRDLAPLRGEIESDSLVLRMGSDGRHRALRFGDRHGPEARQWLRNLVSGLQFVVDEEASSWLVEQEDLSGTMQVRYVWDPRPDGNTAGTLRRELVDVVRLAGAPDGVEREAEANYWAMLGGTLHWFGGGAGSERWVVTLPNSDTKVRSQRSASFELLGHDRVALDTERSWTGPWAALDGSTDGAILARRNELERQRGLLADLTIGAAMQAVMLAAEGGRSALDELTDARQRLTWLLRVRPGELEAVRAAVLGVDPDSRSAAELLAAVGDVGSRAAESMLSGLLGDGSLPESLRLHTALSMFQIDDAAPETVALSERLFSGATGDGDLRRATLLLLGRFGDGSGAAVAGLRGLEEQARRDGLVTTWLEAVGNARTPAAVELAAPYLVSVDPVIRVAAIHALEEVDTPAATAALVGCLDVEANVEVRKALVFALGGRPVAVDRMGALLRSEPSESVRLLAVGRLAAVSGPVVTQLLQRTAATDESQRVRDRAAELLAAQ